MKPILAGKSTLNRLEPFEAQGSARHHKIRPQTEQLEGLLADLFLESYRTPPRRIVLDLDATDDPLHGGQEGRFFHGHCDSYCYLPQYIFCGRHLLCAKLRAADHDGAAGALEEVSASSRLLRSHSTCSPLCSRPPSWMGR